MRSRATWAFLFLLLGSGGAAVGQSPGAANCRDDRGVDRCAAERQAKVRALFGVAPIDDHATRGEQVRRAFYVDGYGKDLVAISFVRAPGHNPVVEVRLPPTAIPAAEKLLTATVPQHIWNDVIERSKHFDRKLAPRTAAKAGELPVSICMHSWVYTIEASDPASRPNQKGEIRSATEDACDDGLAGAFALYLAKATVPLFPACEALDQEQHRNEATLLGVCSYLSGDRLAAAAVMNRLQKLRYARSEADFDKVRGDFAHRASIDWNGERVELPWDDAARFWLQRLAAAKAIFYPGRIHGERFDRARMEGVLQRSIDDASGQNRYETAQVQMLWVFQPSQEFDVESVTVGPFQK